MAVALALAIMLLASSGEIVAVEMEVIALSEPLPDEDDDPETTPDFARLASASTLPSRKAIVGPATMLPVNLSRGVLASGWVSLVT